MIALLVSKSVLDCDFQRPRSFFVSFQSQRRLPFCPPLSNGRGNRMWNVLGELELDVSGGRGVDEQVLVMSGLFKSPGVQIIAIGPSSPPVIVAIDDTSPVRMLEASGAGELEHSKGERKGRDAYPESSLQCDFCQ